jgi:hypothetical protein
MASNEKNNAPSNRNNEKSERDICGSIMRSRAAPRRPPLKSFDFLGLFCSAGRAPMRWAALGSFGHLGFVRSGWLCSEARPLHLHRHARASACGHPRLYGSADREDVDGRDPPSLAPQATDGRASPATTNARAGKNSPRPDGHFSSKGDRRVVGQFNCGVFGRWPESGVRSPPTLPNCKNLAALCLKLRKSVPTSYRSAMRQIQNGPEVFAHRPAR